MENNTPLPGLDLDSPSIRKYISQLFSQINAGDIEEQEHFKYSSIYKSVDLIVAGCSYTSAEGVDYGDSWGVLLGNKMAVDYVNISQKGWSMVDIVCNIFDQIRIYGNPKTIAVLATELTRGVEAVDWVNTSTTSTENYFGVPALHTIRARHKDNDRGIHTKYAKRPYVVDEIVFSDSLVHRSLVALNSLIDYCRVANIVLVWGTWDYQSSNLYRFVKTNEDLNYIDLGNYIELPTYQPGAATPPDLGGDQCGEPVHADLLNFGNDGAIHAGPHHHVHWAQMFYDKIKDLTKK